MTESKDKEMYRCTDMRFDYKMCLLIGYKCIAFPSLPCGDRFQRMQKH